MFRPKNPPFISEEELISWRLHNFQEYWDKARGAYENTSLRNKVVNSSLEILLDKFIRRVLSYYKDDLNWEDGSASHFDLDVGFYHMLILSKVYDESIYRFRKNLDDLMLIVASKLKIHTSSYEVAIIGALESSLQFDLIREYQQIIAYAKKIK